VLVSKNNERSLQRLTTNVEKAKAYTQITDLKPETARALKLLRMQTAMPAPRDPVKLAELTTIASRLNATYGAGKFCADPARPETCQDIIALSKILADSRDWDADLEAWRRWHTISKPMRADYARFAELVNEGSREMGFANAGDMWRSGYDMDATAFRAETDRLWSQVQPLYTDLQCYVHGKLATRYADKMPTDGTIPAHITGNMWAQDWSALYKMVEPYPGVSSLDVDAALVAQQYDAVKMARASEDFYKSLNMPALPASFWTNSQLTQPRDRDVVCHASAWDMDLHGDVRIKMCIQPNEEDFRTIYHEFGHVYYYLAYNDLPPLFQSGAHDGFHEAIGDTIQLSLTPAYLHKIGLVGENATSDQAVINEQMKLALEKVVFLPFGKLIDEWRWGVFDGSITSADYNAKWWELRRKYQGVAPTIARTEEDFDPGAKYHVPGNTPYMRYFLAHILQFQFQKALCDAAGHQGPLHECSIYGNAEAGKRYWAMLSKGQSQPWQQTLKELTGGEQMDASPILDYFAPLHAWLKQQNEGKSCGWQ
jgi:peptidyl-dipeptidase A